MRNALLCFVAIALFFGAINASVSTNPLQVPPSEAPSYCIGYSPTTPQLNTALPIDVSYSGVIGTSVQLSAMALTLSFAVVAIALIISRLVPQAGIRNWIQNEYWEIAKSAILIAVIFAMITIIGNIATVFSATNTGQVSGGEITPLITDAELYLCNVNYQVMDAWSWMGLLGAGTGIWTNFKMGNYDFIPVWTFIGLISGSTFIPFNNWQLQTGNPLIGPYGSAIGDSVNFVLFPFTVITLIEVNVLPTMAVTGLIFFIPVGLFFRALPFIRGIGGTMIAIGLGLAVIFPATLIMFNGYFINYITNSVALLPPPLPASTSYGASSYQCPFSGTLTDGQQYSAFGDVGVIACTTMPIFLEPITSLNLLIPAMVYTTTDDQIGQLSGANVFSDTAMYQYMDVLLAVIGYLIMQLILLTFDLVIVYALTDSVARSLGGSIRFQLGGKLRIAS